MALQPLKPGDPDRLGPYEPRGRLGAGGMGVYLGFTADNEAVAVKTLPAGGDRAVRFRLRREAQLLRDLRHPRIAKMIDTDVEADRPWIALRYVAGPSLAEAPTPLAPAPLRQLVDGLAEALAALHRQGLTHRDVKPGNIILTFDGPVLVDLGIAASADLTSLTAEGTTVGSPTWTAPEQLAGGPDRTVYRHLGMGSGRVLRVKRTASLPRRPAPCACPPHPLRRPNLTALPEWLRTAVAAGLTKNPASLTKEDHHSSAIG